jgi:RyR domain
LKYIPKPIDTSPVELTVDILALVERLAEHNHDLWARQRLSDGWKYGQERNDQRKEHPCLVAYDQLPESEKDYDRNTAIGVLQAIMALGYRIDKASDAGT